jgi:alpha-glucosidase (family GH31 glycosyl hydrolase)
MNTKTRCRRFFWIAGKTVILAALLVGVLFVYPMWGIRFGTQRPPLTPPWALECWVWEDDGNTAAATLELLEDYRRNDFPVRTVLIDSPWSTRYNDFRVDEIRFPEPEKFFKRLQDDGYRVVLWMTSTVNSVSKDARIAEDKGWFQQAAEKGYLAGNGLQTKWWKGQGGFIDYSNPEARAWWHGMQQSLLDWGVDGWKLDGTDPYLMNWLWKIPVPYIRTFEGLISNRTYANQYYRQEYRHGLEHNPEFVTLARSLDSPMPWARPWGFAPIEDAPVAWVGDNRHSWSDADYGLERALWCILRSARLGYSVIGSDIGGYHGAEPIPPDLYIRWAQFSAFCGLFLNGGHGERRMSRRTPEELEVIRKFSWLHTEWIPYLYSLVAEAHQGGLPLMRPLDKGDYHFLLGPYLLVAPFYQPGTTRTVHLPEGRWRYLFRDAEVLIGPRVITREFPLSEYPVFVLDGAVIPMHIAREYTGIGERDWASYLTLNLYPHGKSQFTVHPTDRRHPFSIRVELNEKLQIALAGTGQPHILRIFSEMKPAAIICDGLPLAENKEWEYSAEKTRLVVRSDKTDAAVYTIRW